MTVQVRVATVDDVAEIVNIYTVSKMASLPELVENYDHDVAFLTDRWRSYLQEGSRVQLATGDSFAFLAENKGKLVGFAAYHHTRRHDTQAELQSLYVRKEAQGCGIGTALLQGSLRI